MNYLTRETIDGRKALCAHLDDNFNPVEPDKATLVKVVYDDGETAFIVPKPVTP